MAVFLLRSCKVKSVKYHYLAPYCYKVINELIRGILRSVNFRQCPELGVRTEDEVDTGAGPLEFASCAVTALEQVLIL